MFTPDKYQNNRGLHQPQIQEENFNYTYSADRQAEIDRIRKKYYQDSETDKLTQLRQLDKKVGSIPTMVSIVLGVIGSLVLGLGMYFTMTLDLMLLGIIIGVLGICIIVSAYPIYKHVLKKQREKYAPIILQLTDELTNYNYHETR
jgi:uncharacterized membrane protein YeaQ/YmgE (transglycosylase-associated protein family)